MQKHLGWWREPHPNFLNDAKYESKKNTFKFHNSEVNFFMKKYFPITQILKVKKLMDGTLKLSSKLCNTSLVSQKNCL